MNSTWAGAADDDDGGVGVVDGGVVDVATRVVGTGCCIVDADVVTAVEILTDGGKLDNIGVDVAAGIVDGTVVDIGSGGESVIIIVIVVVISF